MIPDRALSIGYGTSTSSPSVAGGVLMFAADANCQMPLRLCQSGRLSCGRGYSGSGFDVDTWLVHGVISGGVFGANAAAGPAVRTSVPTDAVRAAVSRAR